jgi:hypothetical protein
MEELREVGKILAVYGLTIVLGIGAAALAFEACHGG